MNAIKQYRENAGLKQIDLAEKLKVCVDTIRRYESGKFDPRWTEIQQMCQLFSCSAEDLMDQNPTLPPQIAGEGVTVTA